MGHKHPPSGNDGSDAANRIQLWEAESGIAGRGLKFRKVPEPAEPIMVKGL